MGGILIVFNVKKLIVQIEMKEKLDNNSANYETLILSIKQYQDNLINSGEISFEYKMYDIKSIDFQGDSVKLFVLNDREEEIILCCIKDFLNNMSPYNKKIPSQFSELISLDYLISTTDFKFKTSGFLLMLQGNFVEDLYSIYCGKRTPPPRLV